MVASTSGLQFLQMTVRNSAADGTYANMRSLWNAVEGFSTTNNISMTALTGLRYVGELAVTPKKNGTFVKASYLQTTAKLWKMIVERIALWSAEPQTQREEREIFTYFQTGLKLQRLSEPEDQAIPITRKVMYHYLQTVSNHLRAGLWLGWKTASRWDEIHGLSHKSLTLLSPTQILVTFQVTKARQENRADHFIVVVDQKSKISWFWKTVSDATHSQRLWKETTSDISQLMRHWVVSEEGLPADNIRTRLRDSYTAHSIKAGALQHCIGEVLNKHVTPQVFAALAKHAQQQGQVLPPTTVRYLRNKASIALATGTQDLTACL